MKKLLYAGVCVVAMATAGGSVAVAHAAEPVLHACVGESFSQGAHDAHPLGVVIRDFAHAGHFGAGIQQLQLGQVPDTIAINTCNDGA